MVASGRQGESGPDQRERARPERGRALLRGASNAHLLHSHGLIARTLHRRFFEVVVAELESNGEPAGLVYSLKNSAERSLPQGAPVDVVVC